MTEIRKKELGTSLRSWKPVAYSSSSYSSSLISIIHTDCINLLSEHIKTDLLLTNAEND